MKTRFIVTLAAVLSLGIASAAFAQTPAPTPTPVALPTMPPSTSPIVNSIIQAAAGVLKQNLGWDANSSAGTVTYFRRFDMQVRFPTGRYREIHLHQGTVINPRGESIQVGQHVYVQGTGNSDGSLNANVITIQ